MPDLPGFTREQTGSAPLDRMQAIVEKLISALGVVHFLRGKLLDGGRGDGTGPGLTIGTSSTTVDHALGRAPRGFFEVDTQSNGVKVVRSLTQPADTTKQLAFVASASVRVKLWIW